MNHCRRCDSDYEKPGTCNCFAPQQAGKQIEPSDSSWVSVSQCQSCGQWFSGTHTCYGQTSLTTGAIAIKAVGPTPYQVCDHVQTEAARRYRPEGVHVPPLS